MSDPIAVIQDKVNVRSRAAATAAEPGTIAIQNIAGVLSQVDDQCTVTAIDATQTIFPASLFGIEASSPDNSAAFATALAAARAGKGFIVLLDGATYDIASGLVDNYTGTDSVIQFWGVGRTTQIRAVGALVTAGDMLTLDQSRGFQMQDVEFTASARRSAGTRCVVVKGLLAAPINTAFLQDIHFRRCNMRKQYDGLVLLDSPGNLGVIGFAWDGCFVTDSTTGGNSIDIFTPNGEILRISDWLQSEDATRVGGARANSTCRIRAVADLRLIGVENVYCDNGLSIQPAAGKLVNTVWAERCIWGQDYAFPVEIDGSLGTVGLVTLLDNYVDGTDGTHLGFYAHGSGIKGLTVANLRALECVEAVRLDAVTGALDLSVMVSGCATGLHATGSSTNFRANMTYTNFIGGNGLGALVDAGCDHFVLNMVGAKVYCTTDLADNSGVVSKSIVNV